MEGTRKLGTERMKYVYWFRIFISICVFAFAFGLAVLDDTSVTHKWKGVLIVAFCGVWNWLHAREAYNMEKVREWNS
jgi:hypothetical protein